MSAANFRVHRGDVAVLASHGLQREELEVVSLVKPGGSVGKAGRKQ
jgi:hypothetical protein